MIESFICKLTRRICNPQSECLEFRAKGTCEHRVIAEYGKYCSCHPLTIRELTDTGEGLTVWGVDCPHRRLILDSWQSLCTPEEMIEQGCK